MKALVINSAVALAVLSGFITPAQAQVQRVAEVAPVSVSVTIASSTASVGVLARS